jgi:hypothetical protein
MKFTVGAAEDLHFRRFLVFNSFTKFTIYFKRWGQDAPPHFSLNHKPYTKRDKSPKLNSHTFFCKSEITETEDSIIIGCFYHLF